MKRIIGSIIILFDPLSATSLANLLFLRQGTIDVKLRRLRSVLDVPESRGSPVRLLHPSFREFLLDKQRCRDQHFWVNEKEAHRSLAENCLRLMSGSLKRDVCDLRAPGALASEVDIYQVQHCLPADLQYACCYWVQHLQQVKLSCMAMVKYIRSCGITCFIGSRRLA